MAFFYQKKSSKKINTQIFSKCRKYLRYLKLLFFITSRMLWYSNLPCFDVHGVTSEVPDEKSILKACYWKGNSIPCAAIFYPVPTDRGVCCAFNMNPLNEIFNGKTYVSLVIFKINHHNQVCF